MKGQLAVVTGGASGIGAACSVELAKQGARVVVLDRDAQSGKRVAAEINGFYFEVDVSDEASISAARQQIEAKVGQPQILVHSAGIIQKPLPPHTLPISTFDDVLRINQRGTYLVCTAFGTQMARQGGGSIVNIASIAGMRSMPLHAYGPAKAAVISITECLAAEWGPDGVRVNAVSPGYTLTPAVQGAINRGERNPDLLQATTALQRLVAPEEVAKVVSFLASAAASGVTGVNVPVDCGSLVGFSWGPYDGLRSLAEATTADEVEHQSLRNDRVIPD